MTGIIDDFREWVKFLRITGVGDFVKAFVEDCKTDARLKYYDFMVLPEKERTFPNMRMAACRALGLPEDWRYNEEDLRKSRSDDPQERVNAIADLMWSEEQRRRDARMKRQKLLPSPQMLLPGARP